MSRPDPAELAALLRQSLDLLALRVASNRGGYPRHEPVPSESGAIENLATSLAARLTSEPAPEDDPHRYVVDGKVHCRCVRPELAVATAAEQEREAGRLAALALHERFQRGDLGPSEYERLRADIGKQLDDLTRVDV